MTSCEKTQWSEPKVYIMLLSLFWTACSNSCMALLTLSKLAELQRRTLCAEGVFSFVCFGFCLFVFKYSGKPRVYFSFFIPLLQTEHWNPNYFILFNWWFGCKNKTRLFIWYNKIHNALCQMIFLDISPTLLPSVDTDYREIRCILLLPERKQSWENVPMPANRSKKDPTSSLKAEVAEMLAALDAHYFVNVGDWLLMLCNYFFFVIYAGLTAFDCIHPIYSCSFGLACLARAPKSLKPSLAVCLSSGSKTLVTQDQPTHKTNTECCC